MRVHIKNAASTRCVWRLTSSGGVAHPAGGAADGDVQLVVHRLKGRLVGAAARVGAQQRHGHIVAQARPASGWVGVRVRWGAREAAQRRQCTCATSRRHRLRAVAHPICQT